MDLRDASPTYARVMENFEHAAAQFMETGFFVAGGPEISKENYTDKTWSQRWREHDKAFPIGPTFIRKVMRRAAKDLKRPIILCETHYWGDRDGIITVTLKQSKRNSPLIAQYLLLEPDPTAYTQAKTGVSVTRRQDGTNWYIKFHGKRGRQIFNDWKAHCTADPECRKALKLPPLPEVEHKLAA